MLTKREQEIFDLNTLCLTRAEMCKRLNITISTLHTHFNNIAAKLAIPEQMSVQYYMVCLKLRELEKRKQELEGLINEISNGRDKGTDIQS